MLESTILRGMTWNHSRGYDPMVATSAQFAKHNPGVSIVWEKRSLQAFADRPIEDMVEQYDLIVIDHPHLGAVARGGLLESFDDWDSNGALAKLASESVGLSHLSYQYDDRQWALAIDAATPVATLRPELLDRAPSLWAEVLELARAGKVAFALVPINALMVFFGMAKNLGYAIAEGDRLIDDAQCKEILNLMCEIASLMKPCCLELDPIGIFNWMGNEDDAPIYSPFGYGYSNYSRSGYCRFPLVFVDAPGLGNDDDPKGTVLGGTGIAVSAHSAHKAVAMEYAYWIASADCQKDLFFASGGQPANRIAWENDGCNEAVMNFFRNTRKTLDTAWLRPRYDGYMQLQDQGGELIHACLRGDARIDDTVSSLGVAYRSSVQ